MSSDLKKENNDFLIRCSFSTDVLKQSPEFQSEKEAYRIYTRYLYQEGAKQNINNILEIEDTILGFKMNTSTDKEELSVLKAGHERMESAIGALNNVTSYQSFVTSLKSYGIKTVDPRGLPLNYRSGTNNIN